MKFKKKDWRVSKEELIKELENYYIDFQVSLHGGWSKREIRRFLHLNFHLHNHPFPSPIYKLVKQVTQILKEEVKEPQPLNTKDTQYPRGK